MSFLKFKTADPTRRIPTYLQRNTKENIIWQIKMTVLLIVGMQIKDKIEERQWRKKYGTTPYYR